VSVLHLPPKVAFFGGGAEKCARPDINKGMTEVQKAKDERLKAILQEVRQELDCVVQKRGPYAAVVRNYVAIGLKLLMEGYFVEADIKLKLAHRMLTDGFAEEDREDFYEALCAFDLGFFAASLWVHFDDEIEAMATSIWRIRQKFLPYLSEALRVAYLFSIYLKDGTKPRWALYYALKAPNYMHTAFDYSVYQYKSISEVLPKPVLDDLKQILYAQARRGLVGR
jgi:hypothetical protein